MTSRLLPLALLIAAIAATAPARAQTVPLGLPRPLGGYPVPPRTAPALPAPPRGTAPVPAPTLALAAPLGPGQQCRAAIRAAERAAGIPKQLMAAIARVESGRREPDGSVNPWPWSINAEGEDHVFDTKAEAIAAVRALQARGMKSIDVGCMQVNLLHHPDAFPTLEQAFDPVANANYAAKFLVQLHEETGAWPTATAWYHSATPELGADYQRRVAAVWPEEQRQPDDSVLPRPGFASAYASGFANGFTGGFANGYASGFVSPAGGARAGLEMPPAHASQPRIIPMAAGTVGRSLSAYRSAPIAVVAPAPAPVKPASKPG